MSSPNMSSPKTPRSASTPPRRTIFDLERTKKLPSLPKKIFGHSLTTTSTGAAIVTSSDGGGVMGEDLVAKKKASVAGIKGYPPPGGPVPNNPDSDRDLHRPDAIESGRVPSTVFVPGGDIPMTLAVPIRHGGGGSTPTIVAPGDEASLSLGHQHQSERDLEGYAKIEISVKCRKLKKMDWMSKSDPFCVLHITEGDDSKSVRDRPLSKLPSNRSRELGRTEVVIDSQNPDFSKSFQTHYVFEERQTLIVRVYDEDKRGETDLKKHDFQGCVMVSLGELMSAPCNTVKLALPKKRGQVIVQAEEVATCNDDLVFKFSGTDLINRDGRRGKSDPFVVISRMSADGDFTQVWRSEVVDDNLNPQWRASRISLQKICNGDLDRPIRIQIFDWEKNGSHKDMGSVHTSVRNVVELPSFEVTCDTKAEGRLIIDDAEIIKIPTFLEYTSGSTCVLHFMAAIDFTSSNGYHTKRDSLHFIDHRGFANEYQAALSTVGDVLQDYGADTEGCGFPLYGFGAKLGSNVAHHCFQILDPEGRTGVDAMLGAYQDVLDTPGFTMCEPTLFAPVIRAAASNARTVAEQNEQSYTILLLITDGEINDIGQTIDALVEAATDPLSVVIVGVGGGDFANMEKLDGDRVRLRSSTGVESTRDLVQFVPYRKYSQTLSRLAAETLAEIPCQLVNYFVEKGIPPSPPVAPAVVIDDDDDDEE